MKKVAIVLSGGSIKGAFQAGALEIILKHFTPTSLHGISVGSLNGGFLANKAGEYLKVPQNKKEEIPWAEYGEELSKFWFDNITSFSSIGKKRYKGLKGICFCIDLFRKKFKSMLSTDPLQKKVRNIIKLENLQHCKIPYTAGAVNIRTGELVTANVKTEHMIDHIIASTAIPIVMPISYIENEPFLDGGIRDVAPLKPIFKLKPLPEHIICVLCQPENVGSKQFNCKDLLQLSNRLMELVTNELVNNDIKVANRINTFLEAKALNMIKIDKKYNNIPITVIRPDDELDIDLEKFDKEDIARIHRLGKQAAKNILNVSN